MYREWMEKLGHEALTEGRETLNKCAILAINTFPCLPTYLMSQLKLCLDKKKGKKRKRFGQWKRKPLQDSWSSRTVVWEMMTGITQNQWLASARISLELRLNTDGLTALNMPSTSWTWTVGRLAKPNTWLCVRIVRPHYTNVFAQFSRV